MPEHNQVDQQPTDLDEHISCTLCKCLLIDAVTLIECTHSFCRSCLLLHLLKHNKCPRCNKEVDSQQTPAFHSDSQLQTMVYKLAPSHYWQELKQRIEFMNKTSSKLTDAELKTIASKKLAQLVAKLCSADEHVSVELEYTATGELILTKMKKVADEEDELEENEPKPSTSKENFKLDESTLSSKTELPTTFKRYFRCPALTKISHFKKILELKLDLADSFAIFFIDPTKEEVLDEEFSMQDLAYLYSWDRQQPMKLIFTLAKLTCEEDKPPELDVQEMPELCRETPTESSNSLANAIPPCELHIPSLTVSLAANYFENLNNGENGPTHHPPIITTTVPPPPKRRKKMSEGKAKKNSTGTTEPNTSANNPPSAENSLLEPPMPIFTPSSSSKEPTPQPQLPPTTQPLISSSKMPHLLPILPKPDSSLAPPPTSSSLGLVPTNGLSLPTTPSVQVPTSVEQANQNIFAIFNHQMQMQQAQASTLSAAMPQLYNAFINAKSGEENGKKLTPIMPNTSQNPLFSLKTDGAKPNFFVSSGNLMGPKTITPFPFLQPIPMDKPNQLRLPIISATEAASMNFANDKNFTNVPLLNANKPAMAN